MLCALRSPCQASAELGQSCSCGQRRATLATGCPAGAVSAGAQGGMGESEASTAPGLPLGAAQASSNQLMQSCRRFFGIGW